MTKLIFWIMYGWVLSMPYCLLVLGKKASDREAAAQGILEETEASLARWLVVVAAAVPLLQLALSLLPPRVYRNLGAGLWIGLPLCDMLFGLGAAALFFIFTRGKERFLGPCAALWACFFGILGYFGGMAAP